MPVANPLINGCRYDFSTIEFNVDGTIYPAVKEISYKQTLEPSEVMGASPQKLARTRGQLKTEGSFTMYDAEFNDLIAKFGNGFGERVFDIVVNYRENDTAPITTDRIIGARIKSWDKTRATGSDALEVKVELDIMKAVINGVTMIKNQR